MKENFDLLREFFGLVSILSVAISLICIPIAIACYFDLKVKTEQIQFEKEKFYFEKGIQK